MSERELPGGVYGIVDGDSGREPLEILEAFLLGGAKVVQLRLKNRPAAELVRLGKEVLERCHLAGAWMIVCDRADVAAAIGADGVHLGQDDVPVAAARALLPDGIIGKSTHDERQIWLAASEGADYIGFGPVFATKSKAKPLPPRGLPALTAAVKVSPLPVVAIGGIAIDNIRQVVATGVRAAAVISAVSTAWQPRDAVRSLDRAFQPPATKPPFSSAPPRRS